MATSHEDAERLQVESAAEWRAWLEANHERPEGVWLVTWKKASGRGVLPYAESVEEALCFGWIDSLRRAVDGDRSRLWFCPRTPASGWSALNKERVERLEREGRMAPAGQRVVGQAKASGAWAKLDAVERLEVPDDLAAALAARPGARARWDAFPPSARKAILVWIGEARRPATRAGRVEETAARAEVGERANDWARRPRAPSPEST